VSFDIHIYETSFLNIMRRAFGERYRCIGEFQKQVYNKMASIREKQN